MRALLFDAGNTRLKWGLFDNNRISKTGSVSRQKLHDDGYAALTTKLPRDVTRAIMSNVAGPGFATRLSAEIRLHSNIDLAFAHVEREAFGIRCAYRQPRQLGVDRWVAMVGAWTEYRTSLLVVDAGTAITIDAIDKTGTHLGGQIIPGLQMMRDTLNVGTSDIKADEKRRRSPAEGLGIFAKNTTDAVHAGALAASCGAIELSLKRMKGAGLNPKIVLTGGDASRILKHMNSKAIHCPNLVLQGLSIMIQGNA